MSHLFVHVAEGGVQLCFDVARAGLKALEVEERMIQQVRGHGVAERGQHGAAYVGNLFFQLRDETFDARALQVRLRAAQVAGDDRKLTARGELRDVRFAAISQGADDRVAPVHRAQSGRHRLERARKEEIQQKGRDDVVCMMAERDLRASFFDCRVVKNAATQARADRAVSLSFRHEPLDDRVGVALDDAARDTGNPGCF
jgi:hypothetical protein